MMTALGTLDGHLPAVPADVRQRDESADRRAGTPAGDLRLGIAAALASWLIVLAPFLD